MTCDLELRATRLVSEPENRVIFGYKGGNIKCPRRENCNGTECWWENQRTIYIVQNSKSRIPTQTEKFFTRLEKTAEIRGIQVE